MLRRTQTKKLLQNMLGSTAARAVNMGVTFLLVPLSIRALDPTEYAYYAMALSVAMLLSYADLGLGMSIVNKIAAAKTDDEEHASDLQESIGTVWGFLLFVSLLGTLSVLSSALYLHYTQGLTVQSSATLMGLAVVSLGIPTGLVQRILFAQQRSTEANLWNTFGRILALISTWLLVVVENHATLLTLILAALAPPVLVGWASTLALKTRNPANTLIKIKIIKFNTKKLVEQSKIGIGFLVLQLVGFAETGLDSVIIGEFHSVENVQSYDVFSKMYSYIPAIASVALYPIWPAITNARASLNFSWAAKIEKIGYSATFFTTAALSFFMTLSSEYLIKLWLGKLVVVDNSTLIAIAVYSVLSSVGLYQSMLLNGHGKIRQQIYFFLPYICFLLIIKSVAASQSGTVAVAWSLVGFYVIRIFFSEMLRRQNSRKNHAWYS